jgi:WbqC-like protein
MIASAHQPHFLPWLGYLNKVSNSDVFIWLDTVQYRKNYFQNRTQIMGTDGIKRWLTLPVHAHIDTTIDRVEIADARWKNRIAKTIEQVYRRAPHFDECWPPLRDAMDGASDRLNEANYRVFRVLLQQLELSHIRVVQASELRVAATEPSQRLAKLCASVGADSYIAGQGGRKYLGVEVFERSGIKVLWQAFDVGSTAYRRAEGIIVEGVSVIDYLFHLGPQRTRELAQQAWSVAL